MLLDIIHVFLIIILLMITIIVSLFTVVCVEIFYSAHKTNIKVNGK